MLGKVVRDIKTLRIQGASRIALLSLATLEEEARRINAKRCEEFYRKFFAASKKLATARPTEPATRNAIASVLTALKRERCASVSAMRARAIELCRTMRDFLKRMQKDLIISAAKKLPRKATILTHCHSNTVVGALLKAKEMGKEYSVICTETRPLYQGLKTARELSRGGIKTTLIVDSAAGYFLKHVDLVVVGADAICANGDVVNKIGTRMIAAVAKEMNVNFFVISACYKYDPLTELGYAEPIEERPKSEVAARALRRVEIRNPAFDVTPATHVTAVLTEEGEAKPKEVKRIFRRKFDIEKKILQKLTEKQN